MSQEFLIPGYPPCRGESYYKATQDLTVLLLEIPEELRWEALQGDQDSPCQELEEFLTLRRGLVEWIHSYL